MPEETIDRSQEGVEADPGVALKNLLDECYKGKGFVICAGILKDKIDDFGNHVVDLRYERVRFSFDDAKMVLDYFKDEVKKDMIRFIDEGR